MSIYVYILSIVVLSVSFSIKAAELNRAIVAEWPDPSAAQQKRTYCISELGPQFWQDKRHICRSWATDLRGKQIAVYAKTLIAEHLPIPAILLAQTTADKCSSEAITLARQLFSNKPASNLIAQAYSESSMVFKRCVATEISKQPDQIIKATFFKWVFDVETYWPKWSNEEPS